MIAFALLLIAVALVAYFDAKREARMIAARPGGPDLDHKELIWRRLRNIGALVMVAVVFDGTEGWDALWMGLCHAVGAWGVFTMVHRFSLNKLRAMDWRYIAPWGNKYDRIWYSIACLTWWSDAELRSHKILLREYWKSTIVDGADIHRAGTLEYCFEATVLAASITCAILILTNH